MNPGRRAPWPRPGSRRGRRGAGALEFALAAPILLGLLLAIADLGRYVVTVQLAASAATAVADLASQTDSFLPEMDPAAVVTGTELGVLGLAAIEVTRPLDLIEDGALIVTAVSNRGPGPAIDWQRRWGRTDIPSTIGPGFRGIAMRPGEGAVYAEITTFVRPWLLSGRLLGFDDRWAVRTFAVRRPRIGGPGLAQ